MQWIRMLSVSHSIWVVWKKDYWTLIFLLEETIIILMEKIILCTTFKFVKNFVKMKDDPNIIMKGANSESAVIVWDREDYLKKPYNHL